MWLLKFLFAVLQNGQRPHNLGWGFPGGNEIEGNLPTQILWTGEMKTRLFDVRIVMLKKIYDIYALNEE